MIERGWFLSVFSFAYLFWKEMVCAYCLKA